MDKLNEKIIKMCDKMSDAPYADCNETPLVPESAGICDRVDCLSCKQARRLLNAGYTKQEWISVDERLPEQEGKYLIWTKKGCGIGHFIGHSLGNSFEYWDVTHWMPLPPKPKMKGAE